jgi:16S rRNA processing protein RimM
MTHEETARIAVGVIRKPHGVRGDASVEPWTDSVERFEELKEVTLVSPDESRTRETTIEQVRIHGDRVLLRFAGISTPEDVAAIRGWTIEIPESEARTLEADEYFLHDLTGLVLVDPAGKELGTVDEAYEGGGGILLTVRRADGSRYDVPFAADICTEIDLEGRRIVVNLPEGLDEI